MSKPDRFVMEFARLFRDYQRQDVSSKDFIRLLDELIYRVRLDERRQQKGPPNNA